MMSPPPSICFVSPYAYPLLCGRGSGAGGAERQFYLFGRGLAKLGWRVCFITHTPPADLAEVSTEFPVWPVHFGYLGGSKAQVPLALVGLWRAMLAADAHYYVLKVPGHLLPVMALFCRLFRRKLAFWAQMTYDADPRDRSHSRAVGAAQDLGVRLADTVIAQSIDQQLAFERNYGLKAPVVRSVCEPLALRQNAWRGPLVDVLWVGNTHAKKRPDVVLELARNMPDVSFAMAMNRSSAAAFEQWRQLAGALPNMRFLGQVAPLEMDGWFGRTRLLLNTSEREGFPNTFLQAWMNGVPVVSLQIDPDQLIREHGFGCMPSAGAVEQAGGDHTKLAACLAPLVADLLASAEVRGGIGSQAARYVQEYHAPDVTVAELARVLDSCVDGAMGRRHGRGTGS